MLDDSRFLKFSLIQGETFIISHIACTKIFQVMRKRRNEHAVHEDHTNEVFEIFYQEDGTIKQGLHTSSALRMKNGRACDVSDNLRVFRGNLSFHNDITLFNLRKETKSKAKRWEKKESNSRKKLLKDVTDFEWLSRNGHVNQKFVIWYDLPLTKKNRQHVILAVKSRDWNPYDSVDIFFLYRISLFFSCVKNICKSLVFVNGKKL